MSPTVWTTAEALVGFDAGTIARGTAYARQNRISEVEWDRPSGLVIASCRGSGAFFYQVTLTVAETLDPDGDIVLRIRDTGCTCPVSNHCKHAVALIDFLDGALLGELVAVDVPAHSSAWRRQLASFLDATTSKTTSAVPLGLLVEIGDDATLRVTRPGKNGSWVRTGVSWTTIRHPDDNWRWAYGRGKHVRPEDIDPSHFAAAQALSSAGGLDGRYGTPDVMRLSVAHPHVWRLLAEAVDAGITLHPHPSLAVTDVVVADFAVSMDVRMDDAGEVVVRPILQNPAARGPITEVDLLGDPVHGALTDDGGSLIVGGVQDLDIGVRSLLASGGVRIPATDAVEFTEQYLPAMAERVPLQVDDATMVAPTVTGPTCVMTVTIDRHGSARMAPVTRYLINGRARDHDRHASAGTARYRDGDAERRSWERARPAVERLVATSAGWWQQAVRHGAMSGSGPLLGPERSVAEVPDDVLLRTFTFTPAEVAVLVGEVIPAIDDALLTVEVVGDHPDFRAADTTTVAFSGVGDDPEGDWLGLATTVDVDGERLPLSLVLIEITQGATHMLLPSGVYFPLTSPELSRLADLVDEARAIGEIERGRVRRHTMNVSLWDELLELGTVDETLVAWRARVARLASAEPPRPLDSLTGVDADLRDYQLRGVE